MTASGSPHACNEPNIARKVILIVLSGILCFNLPGALTCASLWQDSVNVVACIPGAPENEECCDQPISRCTFWPCCRIGRAQAGVKPGINGACRVAVS